MAAALAWAAAAGAAEPKVLRYALDASETGFDPMKVNDQYSRIINSHIFEAPYKYDYLARPFKIKPNTAEGMPEVSADFRSWTFHITPGIYFADDPVFKGKKRELVAADYVYTWKRAYDPANKSPVYSTFNEEGVIGVDELRQQAIKTGKPFDYDREVEGVRALDRYTVQFKLAKPRPRFLYTLADQSPFGAVAREVIERYGEQSAEHPVGTGPFRLSFWRRSSLMVLERNPAFREITYDAEPNADDAEGQALLARFKGRRLPMVDRVEVAVIEETQPRMLSFLNNEFDLLFKVPGDLIPVVAPGGILAPGLVRRGMAIQRIVSADITYYFFNMEHPMVGGYTPDKVALRRAFALAYDVDAEIRLVRRGQGVPAQTVVMPGTSGYDPQLKTEGSEYSPARARALLDMFGYVDRDGDGWRDMPDGSPLVLSLATLPDSIYRQFDELLKKNMDAINVRVEFKTAKFPEQLKAGRAGQLMMWSLGNTSSSPDFQESLQLLYGPASGGQNMSRFRLPAFDELYERLQVLSDGPERNAILRQAQALVTAYAPHKYNVHRITSDIAQPWLIGFRRPPFGRQFWQYVDIDDTKRDKR
ncbi:ABC transporter substrate-binding protein [Piscinibacter terrae]|nr:ABC transporter substrate-binding protein [Albitalea terrae]